MIPYRKVRKHKTVSTPELYSFYYKNISPGLFILEYHKWREVLKTLMYELSMRIIRKNLIIRLGGNLGFLGIIKGKNTKKLRVNWKASREAGYTVYYTNRHTDYFFFRFKWKRYTSHFYRNRNLVIYKFTPILDAVREEIGSGGLGAWVTHCANNPNIKDYDAPFKL